MDFEDTVTEDAGRNSYTETTTVEKGFEVSAEKEFFNGYPNLEGFVPSVNAISNQELFESIITRNAVEKFGDYQVEKVDVQIRGNWRDWIIQAINYQSERPEMSIMDCFLLFKRWDCVKSADVNDAEGFTREFEWIDREMKYLTDEQLRTMRKQLLEKCGREDLFGLYNI